MPTNCYRMYLRIPNYSLWITVDVHVQIGPRWPGRPPRSSGPTSSRDPQLPRGSGSNWPEYPLGQVNGYDLLCPGGVSTRLLTRATASFWPTCYRYRSTNISCQ
jgi:hypothetical protein